MQRKKPVLPPKKVVNHNPPMDREQQEDHENQEDHITAHNIPYIAGLKSIAMPVKTEDVRSEFDNPKNVVRVSQRDIDRFATNIDLLSRNITKSMLNGEALFLLSLEKSSSFIQAFLRDAIGVDAEVDTGVMDVVSDVGKMSIVFQAVHRSRIPKRFKILFFNKFVEQLAVQSCDRLIENQQKDIKRKEIRGRMRELEIMTRNKKAQQAQAQQQALQRQESKTNQHSNIGVKRSRT